MIADWTVDVGPESPLIAVPWEGWIDLRLHAGTLLSIPNLPEVRAYPELGDLLQSANTAEISTSKVDVFPVTREEVDPEIAESGQEQTAAGLGSYLDLVAIDPGRFVAFEDFERVAREAARTLSRTNLPLCCAEVVVRPARLYDRNTFGWTLYAVGFGPDEQAARATWSQAATVLVDTFNQALLPEQVGANRGE